LLADGIPAYLDQTGWHIAAEETQRAVVFFKEGAERMLLEVTVPDNATSTTAKQMVWVTPIPARASDVKVDILRGFPSFSGGNPVGELESGLRGILLLASLTQIWTIPPAALLLLVAHGEDSRVLEDIDILTHMYKDGIALEVLEARSLHGLARHLAGMGIDFPKPALAALEPYIGGHASLVVFRIADLTDYKAALGAELSGLGVELTFPSDAGFFPLVASAALPERELRILVTAPGFMAVQDNTPPGMWSEQYVGRAHGETELLKRLGLKSDGQYYTRFSFRGFPKDLIEDLRFLPGASITTRCSAAIVTSPCYPLFIATSVLFIMIACSLAAAFLLSRTWPRGKRPSPMTTALLGLANLLSLIGLLAAALAHARRAGIPRRKALLFAFLFTTLFSAMLICLALLTSLLSPHGL
jgi:hypothetical protein